MNTSIYGDDLFFEIWNSLSDISVGSQAVLFNTIFLFIDGARRTNSSTAYAPPVVAPQNKETLNANIRNMKDSHFKIRK